MTPYITVNEDFIDDVKDRIKRNVGNAADTVGNAMDSVHSFGKGVVKTANMIAKGADKVSKYMRDEENIKPVKKQDDEDDDDEYYNEASYVPKYHLATTSLIKRQIPNGAKRTLVPIKQVKNTLSVFNKKFM
jgi:hypothetical protein